MSEQDYRASDTNPQRSNTPVPDDTDSVIPVRKKRQRVVRPGGEKVTERDAVISFRLADEAAGPRGVRERSANSSSPAPTLSGNDARLLDDVPPHWGKQ